MANERGGASARLLADATRGWCGGAGPLPFFGRRLSAPRGKNGQMAAGAGKNHETVGEAGYCLIGLHAAAALFHHYFLRDNTLRRMLPSQH